MIKKTVAFTNPVYLSLKDKQLVINIPEDSKISKTIPIEDIGVVVLEHKQITITHALISALVENNCALITCGDNMMPTGLTMPLEMNTIQSERFICQFEASLPLKKQLWQQTIQAKISNQAGALRYLHNIQARNMLEWANDVRSGDADNKEARAAAYYWKNMFPQISFFTRDPEGFAPNNLLNYGYAILRAIVARALVSSGLLPTLGIHHHNRYNAYCLADDIMEPYRPYVDVLVADIIERYTDYEKLTTEIKRELLQIPTIDVTINENRSPLMIAVSITTASLAKCFSGELRRISYPEL
jgi:CRISP-associated protein Cas1